MKLLLTVFFLLNGLVGSAQVSAVCDTIYESPEIVAKYRGGVEELSKYATKKIIPIIGQCMREDKVVISKLRALLTIDMNGKIIGVKFIKSGMSKKWESKLRVEYLKMPTWISAKDHHKNVCSTFLFPIACMKWDI